MIDSLGSLLKIFWGCEFCQFIDVIMYIHFSYNMEGKYHQSQVEVNLKEFGKLKSQLTWYKK